MTATYVRRLFDQHAPEFDASLLGRLDYRGPAVLLDALKAAGAPQRFESVLDLGCGTGLAGVAVRPFCQRLTGMDISPGMIEQARGKAIYDRLEAAELLDFLGGEPPRAIRPCAGGGCLRLLRRTRADRRARSRT